MVFLAGLCNLNVVVFLANISRKSIILGRLPVRVTGKCR